jgi:hypothetical protein
MTRLVRFIVCLYPRAWRRRYGPELEALIDDMGADGRVLFDVLIGAVTMQIRTLAAVPAMFALAGVLCGALVTYVQPRLYASTSTVRFERSQPVVETGFELQLQLQSALERATRTDDVRRATAVELVARTPTATTLRVTSFNSDPAQAQRLAQSITTAVAAAAGPESRVDVISAAGLPAQPVRGSVLGSSATGGAVGLVTGAVLMLVSVVQQRRRRAQS